MKKFLKITVIAVLALVVLGVGGLVGFYAWLGGFDSVEVKVVRTGGEAIVYESGTGPYHKSGEITERLFYQLKDEDGVETTKGIGLYYDNPKHVETDKLRYDAGEVLEGLSTEKMEQLGKKYKIKHLPQGEYLTVTFPFKSMASIFIGITKAYPAFEEYLEKNNIQPAPQPVQEIYDVANEVIIYRMMVREGE